MEGEVIFEDNAYGKNEIYIRTEVIKNSLGIQWVTQDV